MGEVKQSTALVPGRIGIVGLGLMGGSFAKALHAGGREVYGWNRTHSVTELAEIETIDGELTDDVVPTCELIVLADTPGVHRLARPDGGHPLARRDRGSTPWREAGDLRERCFKIAEGRP